jgi:hypothetical protein
MAAVNINVTGLQVRTDIAGLMSIFSDVDSKNPAVIREIAPELTSASRRFRLYKPAESNLMVEGGPQDPLAPVGWNAPARIGSHSFTTSEATIARYAFGSVIISDADREEAAAAGVDAERAWAERFTPQGWAVQARLIGGVLATNGNYDATLTSTSLALTTETADYIGALNTAKRAFRALGIDPSNMFILMNDVVADRLTTLNQTQEQGGFVGYTASGGTTARTGVQPGQFVSEYPALEAWHAAQGLKLRVLTTRTVRSNGTVSTALEDDIYILAADPGATGRAFLKRGVLASAVGGPATPYMYPNYNPGGTGAYMDGSIVVATPSTLLGYRMEGVLS